MLCMHVNYIGNIIIHVVDNRASCLGMPMDLALHGVWSLSSLQRYLTALRKEKEAFHQLIREKGVSWCQ